jgi:hypothetical protein
MYYFLLALFIFPFFIYFVTHLYLFINYNEDSSFLSMFNLKNLLPFDKEVKEKDILIKKMHNITLKFFIFSFILAFIYSIIVTVCS